MEPRRVFFVLSFVSMIVLHGKERETCVEERKGAQKSGGMRGRAWISMTLDGRIGLGGWKEDVVFSYILLSSPLVMLVG